MKDKWDKWFEWGDMSYEEQIKDLDKDSARILDGPFYGAVSLAKKGAKMGGFLPCLTRDGEPRFTIQQGLRAACQAREDAAAILLVQLHVVRVVRVIAATSILCLAVLIYITLHLHP